MSPNEKSRSTKKVKETPNSTVENWSLVKKRTRKSFRSKQDEEAERIKNGGTQEQCIEDDA